MNRNTTYALFGATFALVAGMVGGNFMFAQPFGLVSETEKPANDGMKIYGHVTTIVKDANDHIKAYRQTDNVVVTTGKNCVSKLLFGGPSTSRGAAGSTVCVGANTTPWNVIAIGNGSGAVTVADTDYKLAVETANGNGLQRQAGTITYTNSTTGVSATALIQATYTVASIRSTGTQVTESGLFNSTTVGTTGMFAHQAITSIPLNNGDSLTVKWTINIG